MNKLSIKRTKQLLTSHPLTKIPKHIQEEKNKIKRSECPYGGIDCAWCGEDCE